jgi:DNA (cytosine-5)-methyltransferase 1
MNVLELFAGCGGLGYGFQQNGFNMVCANELEKVIASTYSRNNKKTQMVVGDITDPAVKDKILSAFKQVNQGNPTKQVPVQCDVIIGGPPCVAYSMSGHRNSRDPRGQLFQDYVYMVQQLQPSVFIMENVKGILTMQHDKSDLTKDEQILADKYYLIENQKLLLEQEKKHAGEDRVTAIKIEIEGLKKQLARINPTFRIPVYQKIIQTFASIGYNVHHKLLNSADYGVPQKRERVIFIGVKQGQPLIDFPLPTHHKDGGTGGLLPWVSVKTAIDDLKNLPETPGLNQVYTHHSDDFIEKIKKTACGTSVNPKYTEAFFRCHPDQPSNTVKENHGGVFVHYEKNRVMTPRELARLQSFPDDFIFEGTKSNILVQLGNAVPCGLSNAIAKQIAQHFKV